MPNFGRLQKRLMWVGLAAFLVVGYLAFMFFGTNAKVTLYVNGSKVNIDTSFTVDPNVKQSDQAKAVLAGQMVTVSKDLTGSFTPTGKKDVGTKATGQITMYNSYDTESHTLVAGTRLQAPDGKVFRTKNDADVPGASISLSGGHLTLNPGKSAPINVEADQAGDSYNEAPADYSVVAYTGDMKAKITGKGGQMSGGTTKTITVVTQSDVDTQKASLIDKDKDNAARDLKGKLPGGYVQLDPSQATSVTTASSSPDIDAEASTATLTVKVTYAVLAVKESDYQDIVRAQEQKQIGDKNQIYDDGISSAQLTVSGDKDSSGKQSFHFTTEAYGGQKLDTAQIAGRLKGQRYGDATSTVTGLPGVTKADIALWPGWATSLPNRTDKIHISIQVAGRK